GRGQLWVLDERVKRKREIFEYYKGALGRLAGIEFMPEPEWSRSNRWLTVILITPEEFGADPSTISRSYGAGREEVRLALEEENIEARPVWKPMHLQPVFQVEEQGAGGKEQRGEKTEIGGQRSEVRAKKAKKRYRARVVGGEVAEDLFERGLCLPSGTAMSNSDLDRVIETIMKSRAKSQSR
ncbi:MAG: DegT/DnrJ/EryC1/StrS family aminotransferase, partial [Deltaproteobacteria bacterium]|nr:DegT/DnrJ/EryC1/StrS family aminotransferase [Deltaproteobacteria bacterium]